VETTIEIAENRIKGMVIILFISSVNWSHFDICVAMKCYLVDRAVAITSLFCTHVGQVTVGVVFLLFNCGRRSGT
jgi:hypothetical protein